MEIRDRSSFLSSRLETTENNFNMKIPFLKEHTFIMEKVASNFKPASKCSDDIKELVTGKLNLCRDKNVLIFYQGDGFKLNTLCFYLLMNFISNWKLYNQYISNLVSNDLNNYQSLSYNRISLESLAEMRFREDNEMLYNFYNLDILFLTVQPESYLFGGNKDFYKELLRIVLNMRNNLGLVTVIIYLGTEKSFKDKNFESQIIETPMERYNLTDSKTSQNHKITKSTRKASSVNDEEVFE